MRTLTDYEKDYYSRNTLIPEIGEEGQGKLLDSSVLETLGVAHLRGTCQGTKKFSSRFFFLLFIPDHRSLVASLISIYWVSALAAPVTHQ